MTWFLSLFPQFRHLQEALQAATSEKLILQDRLDSLMHDRSELWRLMESAVNNERAAYQMSINAQWQKQGFGAPYPEAPMLPPQAVPQQGGGTAGIRPEMPSTRVARQTDQFIKEVLDYAIR
jgi:hypothetical protein